MLGGEVEQSGDRGPSRTAVGDGDQGAVVGKIDGQDGLDGTRPGLGVGLPSPAGDIDAGPPRGVLVRMLLARLLRRQPLPGPEVQLPQPGIQPQRYPTGPRHDVGSLPGPGQVTTHDGVGTYAGEHLRRSPGLRAAHLVEVDVQLTLDDAAGVVRRTAVAEQDDPTTQDRPAARWASWSTKGMTGQSFQRRSRA